MSGSDFMLLASVSKKNIHFDRKSLENLTGKVKPKYKLARGNIRNIHLFNVLSSSSASYAGRLTVKIDWDNDLSFGRRKKFTARYSYCDVSRVDHIEEESLLIKLKSRDNGFPHVATVKESVYAKILKKCQNAMKDWKLSDKRKALIEASLPDTSEEILNKLGLS